MQLDTSANYNYFNMLLDYELRSAERYRRFVSLVSITSDNDSVQYEKLLHDTFRTSDEIFENGGNVFILMAETDVWGALRAIERYKRKCQDVIDIRFSVALYPHDGQAVESLLRHVRRRLDKAKADKLRTVVSSG